MRVAVVVIGLALAGIGWLLVAGCYLPISVTMKHPETGDVKYCWGHVWSVPGPIIVTGANRSDVACQRELEAKGYRAATP